MALHCGGGRGRGEWMGRRRRCLRREVGKWVGCKVSLKHFIRVVNFRFYAYFLFLRNPKLCINPSIFIFYLCIKIRPTSVAVAIDPSIYQSFVSIHVCFFCCLLESCLPAGVSPAWWSRRRQVFATTSFMGVLCLLHVLIQHHGMCAGVLMKTGCCTIMCMI